MAVEQAVPNESGYMMEYTTITRKKTRKYQTMSNTLAVLILLVLFVASFLTIVNLYGSFPKLKKEERQYIKFPFNIIKDAQNLGNVLKYYKDAYYTRLFMLISLCYIFLQTFAIPGSIALSILCGFLYPFLLALAIICFCSTMGACLCYILSMTFGRQLVYRYFPCELQYYEDLVEKYRNNMFYYIVFLRITPVLPDWYINICAPLIDVPFIPFCAGTFFGVAVPSVLAILVGQTIHDLIFTTSTLSWCL